MKVARKHATLLVRRAGVFISSTGLTLCGVFVSVSPAWSQQAVDNSRFGQVDRSPGSPTVIQLADYDAFTKVPRRDFEARPSDLLGAPAVFDVTYVDFPPQAVIPFQHAVDIWSSLIESSQTIRVQANWTSIKSGTIGSALPGIRIRNFFGAPIDNYWFSSALADAIAKGDHDPGGFDIIADINSDTTNWYFGVDGNTPAGQLDLVTVMLHEIGHALGFEGSMRVEDGVGNPVCSGPAGVGCYGRGSPILPDIYDRYAEDFEGMPLLNYPQESFELGNALTSGNIFFNSLGATESNGGSPPPLYAPNPAEGGSTYTHLDEDTYPDGNPHSLMTPRLATAESNHDPGDVTLCMLEDMGWRTVAECEGGGLIGPTVYRNQAAQCFGFSAISQEFSDFNVGVDAADDFVVPPGETWTIDTIVAPGLYVGNSIADRVNVYIYRNGINLPTTIACLRPDRLPVGGTFSPLFEFDLTTPCILEEGTYWLSVQAVMDLNPGPDQTQWNWAPNGFNLNGNEYHWRDEDNFFGIGCNSWSPHSICPFIGSPDPDVHEDLCFGLAGPPELPIVIYQGAFENGDFSGWSSVFP